MFRLVDLQLGRSATSLVQRESDRRAQRLPALGYLGHHGRSRGPKEQSRRRQGIIRHQNPSENSVLHGHTHHSDRSHGLSVDDGLLSAGRLLGKDHARYQHSAGLGRLLAAGW